MGDYTKEIGESICADIACGSSVAKAAENNGFSDRAFYKWLTKYPDLVQNYMRARDIRADARFESSSELMQELRNDVITSDKARIMLDEIKWKCGKESAKKYGDRQVLSGDSEQPVKVDTTIEIVHVKP